MQGPARSSSTGGGLSRRRFLAASGAWVALPALCRVAAPAARRPPNVLFVLSDSHRASSTGCYGDDQVRTPEFDAFARDGLRLTTAISNTPVCRPYRASLMSGLYAHHHGLRSNDPARNFGMTEERRWIRPDLEKLAQRFGAAGYRCGYVGKWHLGPSEGIEGDERLGFDDDWFAAVGPHEYDRWTYALGDGSTVSGEGRFRPAVEVDRTLRFVAEGLGDDEASSEPFFAVLSWGPPHEPLEPPPELLEHYTDVTLPPNVTSEPARELASRSLPPYLALIEGIDGEFGRLLRGLDSLGIAEDTVVVYTSDHGNQIFSHDMSGKGVPYSESTRVPFLVRWPGRIGAGRSLRMPFGAPDIAPTLLGLAGLEAPAGIDGRNFADAFLGVEGADVQEHVYLQAFDVGVLEGRGWRGVRTERHLFARRKERPWMLFDVQEDPFEQHNLLKADKPLRKELDGLTQELMESLGDSWAA